MVFDPSKAIKKMIGPGVNVPRFRQGRNARDTDGDGINDIMDCQPKNMFRQDYASFEETDEGIINKGIKENWEDDGVYDKDTNMQKLISEGKAKTVRVKIYVSDNMMAYHKKHGDMHHYPRRAVFEAFREQYPNSVPLEIRGRKVISRDGNGRTYDAYVVVKSKDRSKAYDVKKSKKKRMVGSL